MPRYADASSRPRRQLTDIRNDDVGQSGKVLAHAGAAQHADGEPTPAARPMARSWTASPITATSAGARPTAAQKACTMPGPGLAAEAGIGARREDRTDAGYRACASDASIPASCRWWRCRAGSRGCADLGGGLVCPRSAAVCAPPRTKMRAMPATSCWRRHVGMGSEGLGDVHEIARRSGAPGVMRSVSGSWPPSRNSSAASAASPCAA